MGVGDKWDGHPGADRLILGVNVPRPPPGAVGERERAGDRQEESEQENQRAPQR